MNFILSKIEKMSKPAYKSLCAGLIAVMFFSILLVFYIISADGFKECTRLAETIPSVAVSVPIVFGGALLVDIASKENDNK